MSEEKTVGSEEYLDEFVEWDNVPSWNAEKKRIEVWLEKITIRDLVERSPEVGSEEAIADTAEALRRLVELWPRLPNEARRQGLWLCMVPPLLRELGLLRFSPRYPEMLEAMRRLGLSVKLTYPGWVDAEELHREWMWEIRTREVMDRQRRATRLNWEKEYASRGLKWGYWGPTLQSTHPKFDKRSPGGSYGGSSVERWFSSPASRGFSPDEARRLASYMAELYEELQGVRLPRRLLVSDSESRLWKQGDAEYEEFSRYRDRERQIEVIIEKLATGSHEDFLEYERTFGRHK